MKGIHANIYLPYYGSSANGGVSGHVRSVTIVGEGIAEIFEAQDDCPAVELVTRSFGGLRPYTYAQPIEPVPDGMNGYMFGGSFIYSSDSRFPSELPIPLHDRCETQEEMDILSR
jgi:hypothetical protein